MTQQVPRPPVGTLARGLRLVSCVAAAGRKLGLTELAQISGLDKATTYRLANTLVKLGYLEQEHDTRRFRLGLHILDLGFAYLASLDIRSCALPEMRLLREEFDGTISLSILDGTDIVYIERFAPKRLQASAPVGVGARLPAHCTAMGKALLAFLPDAERGRLLQELELTPWTPYTVTDRAQLTREIEAVRQRGFALSEQETVVGLRTAAAPILDQTGAPVAALSVAVSTHSIDQAELATRIAPRVVRAASAISSHLGHRSTNGSAPPASRV